MHRFLSRHEKQLWHAVNHHPEKVFYKDSTDHCGVTEYGCKLIRGWIKSLPFPRKDLLGVKESNSFDFIYQGLKFTLYKPHEYQKDLPEIRWPSDEKKNVYNVYTPGRFRHLSLFVFQNLRNIVETVNCQLSQILAFQLGESQSVSNQVFDKWKSLLVVDSLATGAALPASNGDPQSFLKAMYEAVRNYIVRWRCRMIGQYPAAFVNEFHVFGTLFEFRKDDLVFFPFGSQRPYSNLRFSYSSEIVPEYYLPFLRIFPSLMRHIERRIADQSLINIGLVLDQPSLSVSELSEYFSKADYRQFLIELIGDVSSKEV